MRRARAGCRALAPTIPPNATSPPSGTYSGQSRCRRGGFFAFGCNNPLPDLPVQAPGQEEALGQQAAHDLHTVHRLRALVFAHAEPCGMLRRWSGWLTDKQAVASAGGLISGAGSSRSSILRKVSGDGPECSPTSRTRCLLPTLPAARTAKSHACIVAAPAAGHRAMVPREVPCS